MRVLGVIPARYASTRLPGKPLADICGKTLIQRVYERAALSRTLDRLVVATDDARILEAVRAFGGECLMTSPGHPNGTCRVAEASKHDDAEVVINIQGDEPLLDPVMIDEAAGVLREDDEALSSTLCAPITDPDSLSDPNTVKVVTDLRGYALFFSRSPIPYRQVRTDIPLFQHIGIYGFRRDFLFTCADLAPTPLSEAESLEQLRILEHGFKMKVIVTRGKPGPSVDTPKDLERVRTVVAAAEKGSFEKG